MVTSEQGGAKFIDLTRTKGPNPTDFTGNSNLRLADKGDAKLISTTDGTVYTFSKTLDGEDWFEWDAASRLSWADVKKTLSQEVRQLRDTVDAIDQGKQASPLSAEARFDQVLGITGHAAYHAGQIQLVKALVGA